VVVGHGDGRRVAPRLGDGEVGEQGGSVPFPDGDGSVGPPECRRRSGCAAGHGSSLSRRASGGSTMPESKASRRGQRP
jgi:hypothetical protein